MTEQKNNDSTPVASKPHYKHADVQNDIHPTEESVTALSTNKPELSATVKLQASNQRSVEEITYMILQQKAQTVQSFIKIGALLIEAKKQLVRHGQWRPWLIYNVDISERTAERYMQLAEAYGNSTSVSKLCITKALILLELPEEDRETFINSSHEVDGQIFTVGEMTTREMRKAVHNKRSPALKEEEQDKVFQPIRKKFTKDRHNKKQEILSDQIENLNSEKDSVKMHFDCLISILKEQKFDAGTYGRLEGDIKSLQEKIGQCIDLIKEKKECADFS